MVSIQPEINGLAERQPELHGVHCVVACFNLILFTVIVQNMLCAEQLLQMHQDTAWQVHRSLQSP